MPQPSLKMIFGNDTNCDSFDTQRKNENSYRLKSIKSSKVDHHRVVTKKNINNAVQNLISQLQGLNEYELENLNDSEEDNSVDLDASMKELFEVHREQKSLLTSRSRSISVIPKTLTAPSWVDRTYSQIVRTKHVLESDENIDQLERSLEDFKGIGYLLSQLSKKPDVEIDESGTIGLYWDNHNSSFCVRLIGNGGVIGSYAGEFDQQPWSAQTSNERLLIDKLKILDNSEPTLPNALQ